MKKAVIRVFVGLFIVGLLSVFYVPTRKLYHFPQVGLYVSVSVPGDGYGYVLLSREGYVTELSDSVDYIVGRCLELANINLILKPGLNDTVFLDKSNAYIVSINPQKMIFTDIDNQEAAYFQEKAINGGGSAYFPKTDFFEITVSDYLNRVYYWDGKEDNSYIIKATPDKVNRSFIWPF